MEIKNNFELREYQKSILETCKNKNTLVVIPTGLGKTKIGIALAVDRLNKIPNSKILVCSPTKPLSAQICNEFKKETNLDQTKISLVTGAIQPKNREVIWNESNVVICTPQTAEKDLENKRVSMENFSLLVIDECVTGDTKIRLAEGNEIKIEDLYKTNISNKKVYVQSLNKQSGELEPTQILKIYRIKNKKNIFKLKTNKNSEIKVTEDHLFLTKNKNKIRWVQAKNIKLYDKIAYSENTKEKLSNSIIIDEKDIIRTYNNKQQRLVNYYNQSIKLKKERKLGSRKIADLLKANEHSIRNYIYKPYQKPVPIHLIEDLKKENLLPLRYSNPKLKIIVRIIGHVYGDGWFHKNNRQTNIVGFSGKVEDLKRIQKDLKLMDVKYPNIFSRITKSKIRHTKYGIKDVNGTSNSFAVADSKLTRLIKALKIPMGAKTSQKILIPKWLMNSQKSIKKEFLSALMGSEGYKPAMRKKSRQPYVIRLSFNKTKEFKKNGLKYAHQIKDLFKTFKINCNINIGKGNIRKDKKETIRFLITPSNSNDSLIKFLRDINYTYCIEKKKEANRILRYLTQKKKYLDLRRKMYQKVLKLRHEGLKYKEISKKLDISESIIGHWLSKEEPNHSFKEIEVYDVWKKKNNDYLDIEWDEVKKIKRVSNKKYVYDLSIDKNHNYLANNLIVHNCHRSRMKYANTIVAKNYIENAENPRILALTASPGGTKAKINEICENLFIESVEIRTNDDEDIKQHIQNKEIEYRKVDLTEEIKKIRDLINIEYKNRVRDLEKFNINTNSGKITKKLLLYYQNRFRKNLSKSNPAGYYALSLIAQVLKIGFLIELIETQTTNSAIEYFEKLKIEETKAAKFIVNNKNISDSMIKLKGLEHPKLKELKKFVTEEMKKENSKIIIFANYRNTVDELVNYLKGIAKPIKLVGQKEGVTQKQQIQTIKDFASGKYNCLIGTSITEEGLDIMGSTTAIFYDAVPSEIRSIQRRGRVARLIPGKIIHLIAKGTRDEASLWSSYRKEKTMQNILKNMQKNEV